MKVIVESAVVQKNIKLFKKIIERHLHPEAAKAPPSLSTYSAFLNCLTGEILFAEDLENQDVIKGKKWKPICLRVRLGLKLEESGFEVLEEETNDVIFQCDKVEPLARRIMGQMVTVLNEVVGSMHHVPEHVQKILEEVVHLEFESRREPVSERDIVHEAWHQVSRVEAEGLLGNRAVGTFLFRKDRYAEMLEEQLSMRFRTPVRCLTLSYLALEEKVVDLTLVGKEGKWYFYEDDPSLEEASFSSLPFLLKSLKGHLSEPLLFVG